MCRLTLERLNQLEPWISAMADDFDEAAIKAEEDAAKKQADALLAEVSEERRNTDRLRLKDHGDTRDRRRRSRSRERDRYTLWIQLLLPYTCDDLLHHHDTLASVVICLAAVCLHLFRFCEDTFCLFLLAYRAHDDGRERDKHHDREKDRRSGRDRDAHEKKRRRSTSRERPARDGVKSRKADQSDPAIILANEERAKLGLKPLK